MAKSYFVCGLLLVAASSQSVVLGQVDDFEDGTSMAWAGGSFPTNFSTGGPAGVDDNFVKFYQGAPNGSAHLAMYNIAQWSGNYTGAGVQVIEAYMRNPNPFACEMRLVFFRGTARATTTTFVTVPADNIWRKYAWAIRPSDLTMVLNGGGNTPTTILGDCEKLMLRYDPGSPSSGGTPPPSPFTTSELDVDNITASQYASCEPTGIGLIRGFILSGDVTSLAKSDDLRLVGRPGPVAIASLPPYAIRIAARATLMNFSVLRFRVESSGSTTAIIQRIYLLDQTNGQLVEFGAPGTNLTTSDSVVEISITDNPTRFRSATGDMEAQITFKPNGPVAIFPWQARIDHVVWRLFP